MKKFITLCVVMAGMFFATTSNAQPCTPPGPTKEVLVTNYLSVTCSFDYTITFPGGTSVSGTVIPGGRNTHCVNAGTGVGTMTVNASGTPPTGTITMNGITMSGSSTDCTGATYNASGTGWSGASPTITLDIN